MPALKCPECGYSDLHAVDVETVQQDAGTRSGLRRSQQKELGCKRCGWSPSKAATTDPDLILASKPMESNI